jgi:DNA-directed RNA polymerase subunit H (RpoH/RPB5)
MTNKYKKISVVSELETEPNKLSRIQATGPTAVEGGARSGMKAARDLG